MADVQPPGALCVSSGPYPCAAHHLQRVSSDSFGGQQEACRLLRTATVLSASVIELHIPSLSQAELPESAHLARMAQVSHT